MIKISLNNGIITYMAIIKDVKIRDEFITLGQFIKVVDLISSGGEAKAYLLNTKVLINGEEDSRRGRKLYKGDLIVIDEKQYKIC